jgi:hypothetical protein
MPGNKRFPGIDSSWKNSGPVHSWSLLRLSEFGAGTVNGYGRPTGYQQIECGERVWMLRRAVPVCEECAEFGSKRPRIAPVGWGSFVMDSVYERRAWSGRSSWPS